MPVTVQKKRGKWRVAEAGTGAIVKNAAGTPVDGGGHGLRVSAQKQADAINASLAKRGKI